MLPEQWLLPMPLALLLLLLQVRGVLGVLLPLLLLLLLQSSSSARACACGQLHRAASPCSPDCGCTARSRSAHGPCQCGLWHSYGEPQAAHGRGITTFGGRWSAYCRFGGRWSVLWSR